MFTQVVLVLCMELVTLRSHVTMIQIITGLGRQALVVSLI